MKTIIAAAFVCVSALPAYGNIRITEWMYNGNSSGSVGEFVELTNLGSVSVNMGAWSFDDDSRNPGTISLSAFGSVSPGESVILTDNTEAAFRAAWGLPPSVKIIGGNTANLSRNDEINIFDDGGVLVDRLTYGDVNIPGTIRTNGVSGNPISAAAIGVNDAALWKLSVAGDNYGSYISTVGDLGNPGRFVPEPATALMAVVSLFAAAALRRKAADASS